MYKYDPNKSFILNMFRAARLDADLTPKAAGLDVKIGIAPTPESAISGTFQVPWPAVASFCAVAIGGAFIYDAVS